MLIYHLARAEEWHESGPSGAYAGGAHDRRDGFIHFSTSGQIAESARKHRSGEADLLLLAVDAEALGKALRWETSRGGVLFPHLYGPLPPAAVVWSLPLPLDAQGRHVFPELSD